MSNISHIILYVFLFFVFYSFILKKQNYINKNYIYVVIIPILIYSLVVGMRYGWGPDYLWYKFRFEHPLDYEDEDLGFRLFNMFIAKLGFNHVGVFISYSLVFISSGFILLRSYNENKYMIFLFLLATLSFHTTAIRQAFAHSFVFLYIYYLNKQKWLYLIPCVFFQISIHGATILTTFYITAFYFFTKKPLNCKYVIILYILLSLFSIQLSGFVSSYITDIVTSLGFIDNKFSGYIDNSDRWFGSDAIDEERIQSTMGFIMSVLYYSSSIYIGAIALKYKPKFSIIYIYNASVVGFIIFRLFLLFEILKRIAIPLEMLYFIPTGYAFYFFKYYRKLLSPKEKMYYSASIYIIVIYYIMYYGRFILLSPERIFIWN